MSWTYQPDRLKKAAPAAFERDERRADRDTTYKKASAAARKRDGSRCRLCGDHRTLETHHLRPRSLVGKAQRDELRNLVTICAECHQQVTKHIVKLYALDEAEGANGFLHVERWHQPKGQPGEYRTVRARA